MKCSSFCAAIPSVALRDRPWRPPPAKYRRNPVQGSCDGWLVDCVTTGASTTEAPGFDGTRDPSARVMGVGIETRRQSHEDDRPAEYD
jgi:hypothetical protein